MWEGVEREALRRWLAAYSTAEATKRMAQVLAGTHGFAVRPQFHTLYQYY
jgi:hypothetical protein